jgi:hypothetical protein
METLLIRVGCVHRVEASWEYQDYKIDLRIFHGTRLMREPLSTPYQVSSVAPGTRTT